METTRIEARDAALQVLNRLTFWAGAAALAAVGVFAAVSAATIPGHASTSDQTSTAAASSATSSSPTSTNSSGLQSSGSVSSATSGSGMVATGASH